MFRVYKPKGDRVKAVQVQADNAKEIADAFMGRAAGSRENGIDGQIDHVLIPTLDGPKRLEFGMWIVRVEGQPVQIMDNVDFQNRYELAKTTRTIGDGVQIGQNNTQTNHF